MSKGGRTSTTIPKAVTVATVAAKRLAELRASRTLKFEKYRNDPVGFCREVLNVNAWHRQCEILEAVRDNNSVAIRSGHKTGKSLSAVSLALWFVSTRARGRVILTSSSDDQIRNILWKELARIHEPVKGTIGGDRALDHRTGLRFSDGREIIGLATKKPENMAGLSGPEMLMIADEASGIDEAIFEVIEGNRAGGAKLVMFSNPTRTSGKFYDAFHANRAFWKCIHVSSEEAAQTGIPGLATRAYVETRKQEWGVNSPLYQVRIEGNFPTQSENAVVGLKLVEDAISRWDSTKEEGRLEIGVDVARFGDDDSVICPRRGLKVLPLTVIHGFDTVSVAGKVIEIVRTLRQRNEKPRVKVDVIGVGGGVADNLRQYHNKEIELVEVNSSEKSDDPEDFYNLRSQLAFGVTKWLEEGGAIPDNGKLQGELVAPVYGFDTRGRRKVESKEDIKDRLGRSPDLADALALSVYAKSSGRPSKGTPAVHVGSFDSVGIY